MSNLLLPIILVCEAISLEESIKLTQQMEIAEFAVSRFLKEEIDFSSFLEILEMCESLNIDDYLNQVEENLGILGVL